MEKTQDYTEYLISKINETVESIRNMPGCNEVLSLSGDRLMEALKDNSVIISNIKNLIKQFLVKGQVSFNEGILLFTTIIVWETIMEGIKDNSLTIKYQNDKLFINAEKRAVIMTPISNIKSVLFEALNKKGRDLYESELVIIDKEITGSIEKNNEKYKFFSKYASNGLLEEVVINCQGKKLPDGFYTGFIDVYRIIEYFTSADIGNTASNNRIMGLEECMSFKSAGKMKIIEPMAHVLNEKHIIYDVPSMVIPYDFITQFLFDSMNLDEMINVFFNLLYRDAKEYLDTDILEKKY